MESDALKARDLFWAGYAFNASNKEYCDTSQETSGQRRRAGHLCPSCLSTDLEVRRTIRSYLSLALLWLVSQSLWHLIARDRNHSRPNQEPIPNRNQSTNSCCSSQRSSQVGIGTRRTCNSRTSSFSLKIRRTSCVGASCKKNALIHIASMLSTETGARSLMQ